MRRATLVLVALAAAATTAAVQACSAMCADCNCPDIPPLVVTRANDPAFVGAEIQAFGTLEITYVRRGVTWTVTYGEIRDSGDSGG